MYLHGLFLIFSPQARVLVIGGGRIVGFVAVQLAVAAGCHVST